MSTGFVRSCMHAVVENSPDGFERSVKLKELAEKILAKAADKESFDQFCCDIVSYMRKEITLTCKRLKATSSKRSRLLWSNFHKQRADPKGYMTLSWNKMMSNLGLNVESDCILMHAVFRKLFEGCLQEHFHACSSATSSPSQVEVVLSKDELNALRYACGYVAYSLLRKFEKRKGDKYQQFVFCLGEMAVPGEGSNVLEYTSEWLSLVNRGGLFPLNDDTFTLFVEIE